MEEIYERFRDRMEFCLVYIREAHPTDGWQSQTNLEEGVLFRQPQIFEEREEIAHVCRLDLRLSLPILVDNIDNAANNAYAASPERLYVIHTGGKVAYRGGAGPHFFDLDEWERVIQSCLGSESQSLKP